MNPYTQILFDDGELICAGNRYATTLKPAAELSHNDEFVSINPLRERRLDANVTVFRNLLIECDTMSVDLQVPRMQALQLPYSTATFSGGKSVHFVISLLSPLPDRQEYDAVMRRLYRGLEKLGFPVDEACKNPSRFTRNPGHVRQDGRQQTLLEARERISLESLVNWLDAHAPPLPPRPPRDPATNWHRVPSGQTKNFLMAGAPTGQRHRALLRAACDLRECGYTIDEAIERIARAPGIELTSTAMDAIHWAFSKSESI